MVGQSKGGNTSNVLALVKFPKMSIPSFSPSSKVKVWEFGEEGIRGWSGGHIWPSGDTPKPGKKG